MEVTAGLASWLDGDLSPTARIWSAAAPVLLLAGYMFGGMALFAVRNLVRGSFSDEEMRKKGSSLLLGSWLRNYFAWVMSPIYGLVRWSKLPPNAITTLSFLLAGGAGFALAAGRFSVGGWLYVAAAICDFIDGRLARETGKSSQDGALLDSVLDRYCEAAVLLGLAVYYRDSWVLYAVLFALVGSMLVPYVKARGEAMGVEFPNIGLMQRPERIVLLGASVALSPILEAVLVPHDPRPVHRLAVVALVVLAASTQITAIQRLFFGRRALGGIGGAVAEGEKPRGLITSVWKRGGVTRNLLASGLATAIDFCLVALLVGASLSPGWATLLGCMLGGVVHFSLSRFWVFSGNLRTEQQAYRYVVVSGSSALLNAGLVSVLLLLPATPYVAAWLLVRAAVFLTWNHPLSRDYVFENEEQAQASLELEASAEGMPGAEELASILPSGMNSLSVLVPNDASGGAEAPAGELHELLGDLASPSAGGSALNEELSAEEGSLGSTRSQEGSGAFIRPSSPNNDPLNSGPLWRAG